MDPGSLLLILGLLIPVGLYIAKPLLERAAPAVSTEEQACEQAREQAFSSLLAERDRILSALQELDFDYTLEKIPEEAYPTQRGLLVQRGVAILRQMDEFQGKTGGQEPDARLEAALRSGRTGAGDQASLTDEDLEALIANRRRALVEKLGGFCPKCGNPVGQSDRFCPRCGGALG